MALNDHLIDSVCDFHGSEAVCKNACLHCKDCSESLAASSYRSFVFGGRPPFPDMRLREIVARRFGGWKQNRKERQCDLWRSRFCSIFTLWDGKWSTRLNRTIGIPDATGIF